MSKAAIPTPAPVRSYRITAIIIACALLMEQLDATVLSTALPPMARSFGVDPQHMSIALTSYMLSLAVFIPASGRIADRFGSRVVFRGAIILFTIGSMLCGQADGLAELVAARILQGIGGAMMVPVGRLVLLRAVPKSEMVSAMAWVLVPATLGPVLGPPVGGFLTTYLSWRWIFYVNVPVGLLGAVLAGRYIDQVRESAPGPMDWVGLMLSGVALCSLSLGLEAASRGAASGLGVAVLLVAGAAAAGVYVRHARRQRNPILDYRLMRIPTFGVSVVSGSIFRVANGAIPFLLPMLLQLGFGYSAAGSGAITFATAIGSLFMRVAAKPILRRFGFRRVLIGNAVIASALMASLAFMQPAWPQTVLYLVLFLTGFFNSLQFMMYNTIAYADMPAARMSAATSFYNTFQQLFLSAGITVAATVLATSVAWHRHDQPHLADFPVAFAVMAAISLAAAPVAARLGRYDGAEISGYPARVRPG